MRIVLAFVIGLPLGACAGTGPGRPAYPEPMDEEAHVTRVTPRPAPAPAGLTRQRLLAVLDAGPAAFLSDLRVRAQRDEHGFAGWEILALPSDEGRDLGPGDVVVRVNGSTVERPEQLGELWDSLRTAPELVIEILRNGERRELRFPITD